MNREYLINFLKQNLTTIKSYGVTSLALFGSYARDEAKTTSDIDLLVEFQGKVTFDEYMDLKFFLEDNLSLSVDLVTKKMLKPQIIDAVEKDAIYVA
ncbi:DNA polymerase subunit beta [Cylindrospermopsis raciborskii S07]|jgi:predicted nucleotidyltransferase|uniref:Nucleotidyltransferase family protein n=5 Tax=Aphanizomenonaceae TaxID=1892259 RepID=A0A7H0F4B8_9CYAN|nr:MULTISPECIES: nucleotidyltransferase family protein [Aphanizomenonaceae]BAZ78853.1 DNA polymerase beta domain protein region [Sphaerospermopsis kisseleviana NIES-73]BAZ88639.1 DNA polymerase beta domain protein region [Raphidiopsis curvata NIES-932]EFA68533.1 Nucleotidyltransferase [Cylindrospermopsis raciborskii CS-505]MBA4445635.1 nucleotidyltransferase family protein [Cylindrospermopsis raciborskii CS-506_C]MBA4449870.1 nucleotidyltransferase family protein [Cylindrospermopsis raciborski